MSGNNVPNLVRSRKQIVTSSIPGGQSKDASYRFRPIPRVEFLQLLEFLDERFVLVLQHGNAVFQTLDVLFLLPSAFAGGLPEKEKLARSIMFPLFRPNEEAQNVLA